MASLALLAASFGLAALSYYYVETPVRRFGWLNSQAWRPLAAGAAATALVGTLAFVPGNQQERILAERAVQTSALLPHLRRTSEQRQCHPPRTARSPLIPM